MIYFFAGHPILRSSALAKVWRSYKAQEILLSLFAIVVVVLFGAAGYVLIEGWDFFDAVYMTVVTLTTVGYGEVHPLSFNGRLFTIVLMLLGVGVAMLVLTTLARVIIEQQIFWIFERRGMRSAVKSLAGHTIFCGYGRLSKIAIQQLAGAGIPLVIIDSNEERASQAEADGYLAIHGDATADETLLQAGVERASRVVSLLPKDAENMYVVLSARELNEDVYIITRAEDESGDKRMLRAGVNRLISPYRVGGQKIADGVLRPHVTEFLDIAAASGENDLILEEILIPRDSPLAGVTLRDSGLRQDTNIIVAAIISAGGDMMFNPSGETVIAAGATLIGMGKRQDFGALESKLIGGA